MVPETIGSQSLGGFENETLLVSRQPPRVQSSCRITRVSGNSDPYQAIAVSPE